MPDTPMRHRGVGPSDPRRSVEARAWRKLYYTPRWRALRDKAFARDLGVCRICKTVIIGRYDADHIIPHKGDATLFWNIANIQVLHPDCHAALKQKQEALGYSPEIGADGFPIDGAHPFNRPDRASARTPER